MKNIHQEVAKLTDEQAINMTEQYGAHNYHPLHVNITRAEGIFAYDGTGKQYIDCIGSYSAVANGHLSKYVLDTLREQLDYVTLTSRAVYTSELALFLKTICEFTGMDMACPMNTGAEAVETAIKLARKWAYTVKGVEHDKAEILVGHENFHGRTTTIVGFSSEAQYKEGFGPFTPGFTLVPFGDIEAVKAKITGNTAAILLEPIQAEGGILFPEPGYMAELRKVCTENNVLLIWDEIQTGFCRTGKKFAWEHEDAKPDLMCLGKALGGGVMPVAAVVGSKEVVGVFKPGDHGSTFGGNPLACVVGMAAMEEMNALDLAKKSELMGQRLLEGIKALPHDCIEDVRGRGLLVGLEVKEGIDTKALSQAFLDEGVLTKETRSRTFRFAPPLTIDETWVDEIILRTSRALDAVSKVTKQAHTAGAV
ncbi:MAG TPA: ornithine--oxo-acid transaminase [Fimbriimonadaceae bacterium]|nr:ornithine--oxo-acid transaminase [Fimbriimonadaceae bacterium]